MTTPGMPGEGWPDSAYSIPVNVGETSAQGAAAWAATTEDEWRETHFRSPVSSSFAGVGLFRGFLFDALQGLAAGPLQFISDLFSLRWLQVDDLQSRVENIPIIGDFFELVTGVPDSDDSDAASYIRNTVRMLLGGYRNVDPATIPEAEVTPLELTVISSDIQNRITSLEGGVTEYLIASSQEVDVSMFAEIQVIMFGSSGPGGNGSSTSSGAGGYSRGGGYVFQPFTKQDLLDFGLNPAALKCVVGANGGPSYVGADSLTAPTAALVKTLEGSNVVGTPEGYEPTMSGPSPGGGGVAFSETTTRNGRAGESNAIALGGAGGVGGIDGTNQTTATGKPGNPGQGGQTVGLTKCGGSGGGSGGTGGVWQSGTVLVSYYGQNGGNGAAGGFPGGGSGGGGAAGQGENGRGQPGIGGPGVNGLIFLRGKGVAT